MRRSIFSAQPARALCRAFAYQQPRRTYYIASSPTEQAHPVGPFYESVLRTPAGRLPEEKPEAPPVTSQESPAETPKPGPEEKASKPAAEEAPAPAQEDTKAAKPAAKRPRKPRQSAAAKEQAAAAKEQAAAAREQTAAATKSVPSSSSSTSSLDSPPEPRETQTSPEEEEAEFNTPPSQARPSVTFSPSLAGPAERRERLARIRSESRLVAGVLVPPKPEEPDNCCMSGCVNCVWDRFRDEMEDWAAKNAEAERRLAANEAGEEVGVTEESMDAVEDGQRMDLGEVSMDDDGGGSVGNWEPTTPKKITKDFWDDELYKNVPVGIREFMKQEKRLKEKHLREGTRGW